ncbi:TAXI family TRAP transporter solute-binding subunit [Salibacterium sp. K-3]
MFHRSGLLLTVLAFCVLVLITAACGSSEGSSDGEGESPDSSGEGGSSSISLATYPPGIAFNSAGTGIASVISEHSSLDTSVRTFSSPDAWMPMLNNGEVDIGYSDSTVNWFYQAEYSSVEEPLSNLRTLVMGNQLPNVGYTVLEDSDIESLSDLEGETVGDYSSNEEAISSLLEEQLNSVGLTKEDVNTIPVSDVPTGMDMLREGRIDAAFGGDPNASLFLETDNAVGIRGLNYGDYSPDQFEEVAEEHKESVAEAYPNMELTLADGGILNEERIIQSYPTTLVSSTHLSGDQSYKIVKTLFDNYEALHSQFKWLEYWNPESMFRPDPPVPYHKGAIRYFKEEDIWTEEAEQHHQELMQQAD